MEDIRIGMSKMAIWYAAGPDLVQSYQDYTLDCNYICKIVWIKEICQSGWLKEGNYSFRKTLWRASRQTATIPPPAFPYFGSYWLKSLESSFNSTWRGIHSSRWTECLQERVTRNNASVACRQGNYLKNCQRRLTTLSMVWMDYKKAYDMLSYSWILKCLEMVGGAKNMITLVRNSMET